MNIFYLDENPIKSANMLNDKHVVKMIVESSQMLINPYYLSIGITSTKKISPLDQIKINNLFKTFPFKTPYKMSFMHHPCSIWVCNSFSNWKWLLDHAIAIGSEYNLRYLKFHKTQIVLDWMSKNYPSMNDIGLTQHAQAMPDKYKNIDSKIAYMNYYLGDKTWSSWKRNLLNTPDFWTEKNKQDLFEDIQLSELENKKINIEQYLN